MTLRVGVNVEDLERDLQAAVDGEVRALGQDHARVLCGLFP